MHVLKKFGPVNHSDEADAGHDELKKLRLREASRVYCKKQVMPSDCN